MNVEDGMIKGKKSQWTTKKPPVILLVIKDIFDQYLAIFGIFEVNLAPHKAKCCCCHLSIFSYESKVVIVDSWYKQTKIEIVFWNTIYTRANHSEKEVQKCTRYSFIVHTKVQLISKANSKLFIWTKKPTKIFLYSCPSL